MSPAPAFRVDGATASREAFYAVACDPRQSVVVEACAGSGKTWMLVSRIVRALLDGAAPHEILAITFTRATAGEMRARLAEWLAAWSAPRSSAAARIEALAQRGLSPAEAARAEPLLAGLHERLLAGGRPVAIRTFHAWFSQLLRSAPFEVLDEIGLQPDMTLVEDVEEHRPAVFRAFHGAVLRDPQLGRDYRALAATRGRTQTQRWLEAAWRRRVEIELADAAGTLEGSVEPAGRLWPETARLAHPADEIDEPAWRAPLARLAAALAGPAGGGKLARDAAADLADAWLEPDSAARFRAVWVALFTQVDARRKLGVDFPLLEENRERLERLKERIDQQDAHLEHARMVRLARALLAAYAGYKRERGLADMSDLELCALAVLRDSSLAAWMQERLDARVRHLLIDEFQDTNPLQWHALHAWLSSYAGTGGGAQAVSVFIVGDPKQSLYRFRGAEPRVFAAAAGFVAEGLGGRRLACDHTRRGAPAIVAAVNAVFGSLAASGEFAGFRPHTTEVDAEPGDAVRALPRTARPVRAKTAPAAAARTWRDSLATPRIDPEVALREREAEAVAAGVAALLDAGTVEAGGVYVLARKRESLRFAAPALRAAAVAHGPVEDATLMDAVEAQDLVAVLDVLASPQHGLALARALKSPLFSAGDADLVTLAETAPPAGWWQALQQLIAPSPALARAARLFADWTEAARQLPPHDLLDRIVDEGDLRARVVAAVAPEQRAGAIDAIDAVLEQALLLDGGRYATPYAFVRALRRRAVKAALPVRAGAARLLTIHGAKGLESDTVFVMDAEPEPPATETTTLLIDWPVESPAPRRCAFLYSESSVPPGLRATLALEHAAREREALNALYVAMTRARHRLVFSATEPWRPAPGVSWWSRVGAVAEPWLPAAAPSPRRAGAATPVVLAPPAWRREIVASASARPGDAHAAAIGRAIHRTLEWATRASIAPLEERADVADLAAAAAREFGAPAGAVAAAARAVFANPASARFFDPAGLAWSGNEVTLATRGEVARIDRLVRTGDGDWWVLDYKSSLNPESHEPYRLQLLGYRDAVGAAQPGDRVRCAFIAGDGRLVEIA